MNADERAQLIADLKEALQLHPAQLTEEEQAWVRLAIQREAQSIAFRKAIIEKTITGLVWSAVVGCGYVFLDFLRNHGLRL
jgi:hypothetical protein